MVTGFDFDKTGAYQAWRYQMSYKTQQWSWLCVLVAGTIVVSYICDPLVSYFCMVALFGVSGHADTLTDRAEMARRRVEDYEAVSDEAWGQNLWGEMTERREPEPEAVALPIADARQYFGQVSQAWRTHLAILSPTDTGKSSILLFLLSLLAQKQDLMVLAIEPKGGQYPGLPDANVIRVSFRPTLEEAKRLCALLEAIVEEAQSFANKQSDRRYRIVLIIEEWLSIYTTLATNPATKQVSQDFKSLITSLAVVGRGCAVQLVLVAQSAIADDLGLSSGIRSNFRFLALGSRFGGFEGIENTFSNPRIMPESRRDECKQQFKQSFGQLRSNRHPLCLSNLLGPFEVFPMLFLSERELTSMQIESRAIEPRFLDVMGKPTDFPDPLVSDFELGQDAWDWESQQTRDSRADSQPVEPLTISEIEDLIIAFLERKPETAYRASQIKTSVSRLKEGGVELEVIEKICSGLAKVERIKVVDAGQKTRYKAL